MTRRADKPWRPDIWIFNAFTDKVNFLASEAAHEASPHRRPWYGVSLDGYIF